MDLDDILQKVKKYISGASKDFRPLHKIRSDHERVLMTHKHQKSLQFFPRPAKPLFIHLSPFFRRKPRRCRESITGPEPGIGTTSRQVTSALICQEKLHCRKNGAKKRAAFSDCTVILSLWFKVLAQWLSLKSCRRCHKTGGSMHAAHC